MGQHVKLLIVFALTLWTGIKVNANDTTAPYLKIVRQITRTVASDIEKELNIIFTGDGGRMPQKVEEISLDFMAYRKPSIEEARMLEVKATEKLLRAINSNEEIRPYLAEYPFLPNRAQIMISFQKRDNTHYTDGSVALVFQVKNTIFYDREDPLTERLETILEEPYEEASKIVKKTS